MFTTKFLPLNPVAELQVRKLLRSDRAVTAERIVEVARRLHGWQPQSASAGEQAQTYFTFVCAVQALKSDFPDDDFRTLLILNTLAITLGRLYAAHMPIDEACVVALERYQAATYHEAADWLHAKVSVLFNAYVRRTCAVKLLREQMPTDAEVAAELEGVDIQQSIARLVAALNEHRAYGVKPCMIQDGFLHADELAWVFNDGFDMTADLPDGIDWARPLAVTALTMRREIKSTLPVEAKMGNFTNIHFGFRDRMAAIIHASGEFTVDVEVGAVSLREYFVQAGRTRAYDLFRLFHLLRLSHLIVSRSEYAELKEDAWPELPSSAFERGKYREKWKGGLRRLLFPRLHLLEYPDAIRAALDAELAEAVSLTESLSRGKARHDVIGFVRKLSNPNGYPTREAQGLAWKERGIILKQGQTYVRTHKRGSLPNPATGHIAVVKP